MVHKLRVWVGIRAQNVISVTSTQLMCHHRYFEPAETRVLNDPLTMDENLPLGSETAFEEVLFEVSHEHELHNEVNVVISGVDTDTDEADDILVPQVPHQLGL